MGKPHDGQPTALLAESLVDSGMFRIFPSLGTSSQIYAVTVQGHASRKGTSLVKKKKWTHTCFPGEEKMIQMEVDAGSRIIPGQMGTSVTSDPGSGQGS